MQEPDAATTTVRQTVDVFRQSGLSAYAVDTTVMFRKLILEKGNTRCSSEPFFCTDVLAAVQSVPGGGRTQRLRPTGAQGRKRTGRPDEIFLRTHS